MDKVIEIIDSDDDNHTSVDTLSASCSSSNNMETDNNQQSHSRRRRRKSVLHAMTDPDMQFQTIALEDDDEEDNLNNSTEINNPQKNYNNKPNAAAVRPMLKAQKSVPKTIAPKISTFEEFVNASCEEFLNDPETISDIYAIAEERTRINYLLSLNNMPEISFSLYTRPDLLQFQFEELLKQRKMLRNLDNTKVQENRHTLLKNNSEEDK